MVRIEIEYAGELRCRAIHGPSKRELLTDAPVDNHGRGESFSPSDLVATALGTCMATVMGIAAQREGIDLGGLSIAVEKEMIAAPVRRIGRLRVQIRMPAGLTVEQRTRFERIARHCPVHESLSSEIETPIEFTYPGEAAAAP